MTGKIIARLERKSKLVKECPFCGQLPKFKFEILQRINSFGHYAIRTGCCSVTGLGQTELFFSEKVHVGLFRSMAHRVLREWNSRI